jgi:hypothetical protein
MKHLLAQGTFLVALAVTPLFAAKTYYVNASIGSNSYDGLSATVSSGNHGPFLTFAHAAPLLDPGDTLTAATGTYNETSAINVVGHGSPTSLVTIQAADPEHPPQIVEPQGSNATAPANSFKILTSDVLLSGINIQGGVYGVYLTAGDSNITLTNCSFTNSYQAGIMMNGTSSALIQNVTIQGCTVVNCGQINQDRSGARNWPHAILGLYADNVTIENCLDHDNYGEGLGPYTGCQNWTISDNTVYDNYSVNIYLDTNIGGMTVQRNFVYCTYKYDPTNIRNRPDAIRIANETAATANPPAAPSNYTVVNNILCGGDSGIHCYNYGSSYVPQGVTQALIANNTIISQTANPNSQAIVFGYTGAPNQNVTIMNNLGYSATAAGAAFNLAGSGITATTNYNQGAPALAYPNVTWSSTTPPAAADYRLTGASPCVNVGTAVGAPTTDYAQNPRDSQPDIGAYEFIATSYANWSAKCFTSAQLSNPAVSGTSAVPQNDGVPNLLKYLYDINPTEIMTSADLSALPQVGTTILNGGLYLTLAFRENASLSGVTVNVQTSSDLVNWQTVTPAFAQSVGLDSVTGDPLMQVGVPASGDSPLFIRLDVTSP